MRRGTKNHKRIANVVDMDKVPNLLSIAQRNRLPRDQARSNRWEESVGAFSRAIDSEKQLSDSSAAWSLHLELID